MRCDVCCGAIGPGFNTCICHGGPIKLPLPKPPLGVMPRKLWLEKRGIDLSRAIKEYLEFGSEDKALIKGWSDELVDILTELH